MYVHIIHMFSNSHTIIAQNTHVYTYEKESTPKKKPLKKRIFWEEWRSD